MPGRPKLPICPHCGSRVKAGPAIIVRVHNYLLGRADSENTVKTTSTEIGQRLGLDRTSVAGALRRLEEEGVISWSRGNPGGHRGRIRLL